MKYRKGKLLLGTAFLALAVTACGGEKEADSGTAQAEEAAEQEEEQQMEEAGEETEILEAQETEDAQDPAEGGTEDPQNTEAAGTGTEGSQNSGLGADTSEASGNTEEASGNTVQEGNGQTETTAGDSGQGQQSGTSDNAAETSDSVQTADDSQEAAAQSPDSGTESQEETGVPAKVRIYEATYFAEAVYRNVNLETEWPPYCEIDISNVTDTSFDFTVYERTFDGEPQRNLIFKTHTAVFNGDGTTAVYNGQEYTLNFTFPNDRHSLPDVTEIQVTGFAPLEGETYLYNQVPGHEFG
ncbi:MAG TPA: hypothetical protein IAA57_09245 [Candidatus Pullilachnospira intestinigallinarum]|mgnify:FL=1|nr:hypothetical protein [Candidatus Pullilachnospira intestinigallinarum]